MLHDVCLTSLGNEGMATDEPLCTKALLSGYTVDGSFQQYAIGKAQQVARIPKDLPLDAVSPILCAGLTVYKALKETGARSGNTIAITGAGGGLGSLGVSGVKRTEITQTLMRSHRSNMPKQWATV